MDDYYYDFMGAPEDYEEYRPDSYFIEAQHEIREIYERDRRAYTT